MTASGSSTSLYIGALAEYTLSSGTSWRKYYRFAGRLVADYNGIWHDLLTDQEGTPEAQVNSSGSDSLFGSLQLRLRRARVAQPTRCDDLWR